jgi:hypothetical protein
MYVCIYVSRKISSVQPYPYVCVHMYVCMYVRMYVCVYVHSVVFEVLSSIYVFNVCVCVCVSSIYVYMCFNTYVHKYHMY